LKAALWSERHLAATVSRSRQGAAPAEKQSVIKSKDFNLKEYNMAQVLFRAEREI
jgi:hypothetical protein